jgi:ubiquinone/menaquinone biosynthesis C-methylase UbiE
MTVNLWSDGEIYEKYNGQWSRQIADKFIRWLGVDKAGLEACIDMGCGTGALSEALLANNVCRNLTSLDQSPSYLSFAKQRIQSDNVEFLTADAQNTNLPKRTYDLVVSGLVLNFVDSPPAMLKEMASIAKQGAMLGLYIWDFADGMQPIRKFWDAAQLCDAPRVQEMDSGNRFPISKRDNLLQIVQEAGWVQPTVDPIEIDAEFENFDAYWSFFLGGQGTVPAFALSLDDDMREKVRTTLMNLVTDAPDEPFHLPVRAWAAKGRA